MMHAGVCGEDVTLLEGAITLNPNDATSLGWELIKAAAQASANGKEAKADAARAMGGMSTDGEETPALPHNIAALFAGGALVDVLIVEGMPQWVEQSGGYPGAFVYDLATRHPLYTGLPGGVRGLAPVDVLTYTLKERA